MLIEASFAAQYGIRLAYEPGIRWREFASLLAGLGPDTPLGRVMALRRETRPEVLRRLGASERKMLADWKRHVYRTKASVVPPIGADGLQDALRACFGNKEKGMVYTWPQSM